MILDLHIHSRYSFDSLLEPSEIVKAAKKKGLDGIAIVDHNTIKGALRTRECAPENFIVIIGAEINTEVGDIVGLFLSDDINSRNFAEVVKEIHNQGGIAVLAHPYKRKKDINQDVFRQIDAIEGFNSRNSNANAMAQNVGLQYRLPMVAGSDAHLLFEIGCGRTILSCPSDIESMRKAILCGDTKICGEVSPSYAGFLSKLIKYFKI